MTDNIPPPSALDPAPSRRDTRLFPWGCAGLAGVMGYYLFNSATHGGAQLAGGLTALFLSALPALLWARRGINSLPVFELFILTGANTYALPLLNGHSDLALYAPEIITQAILGVIVFQVAAVGTFAVTPAHVGTGRFWTEEVISRSFGRWMIYGVAANTVYAVINSFTSLIPDSAASLVRAVFFGVGIVSTFITSRRLGNNELSQAEAVFFVANLIIQAVAMLTSLYLVATISLILLALVGYISASGRVPLITTGLCIAVLAIFHNGKGPMRTKYWPDEHITPTVTALPGFYAEWVEHGLHSDDENERSKMATRLVERTSLFHMLCMVVNFSPASQPFLGGETYADIPAQFVPRFFWPDKPLGHVSNSRLSVYYGLQTEEDTLKTTIGFGMLSEAYANFGYYGLVGLGLLVGFLFKKLQRLSEGGPLFSYGGLLLIILLAWSFQVEFTLSIWLASFYQAAVAVLGIPFVVRQFFGS